ncbi:ribosomal RNA small subunit methyltransferase B domain protein [Mycobacterium xenopi 4042]|uniref:Ribosomal RNA small subunit methyltransferase B domain protein n=1 Tax=Mycobacterium xenopi 4042 TaxID=1299334 RepID=X7ZIH8_MYCXE|nr:ribosomal RNA small subunit methyltransferase B domain protein [Mycobacterium xenopi 4042]
MTRRKRSPDSRHPGQLNRASAAPTATGSGAPRRLRRAAGGHRARRLPQLALPALLRERRIRGRDAAFATELTYGTCRTLGLLDAIIGAAAGAAGVHRPGPA